MNAKVKYARPRVLINAPRMSESYKNRCRIEAIKEGIKRCSIPDKVYIDNGKDAEEREELEQALDAIDDMVDTIAKEIVATAHQNDDLICTNCLRTAKRLFGLFRKYAREEDVTKLREDWRSITGRDIYD